ncbi:GerAB/ArcD/ProY family transporter [Abyssisolibacter fermentans]|uniref:GerAB/ArcD/ProY family transporter n=1 Tax=Abyssisolibacter fermentans TaxID=1766203 RepID=UPI000831D2D8|nr:endospore germination permease [Abyssisolibacter fermentans]
MNKEIISDKQGIALIILFITGSSSVVIMGLEAKKDLWIAIIIAIMLALPFAFIYSRLQCIFPSKNLYDIIEICFGRLIGKIVIIILTLFVYYWAADVLVNYGNFIKIVSLTETPKIIPMMFFAALCGLGIKKGIEVMGRFSEVLVIIPVFILFISSLLLIPDMNIDNIRPVFYNGIKPILKGAFNSFSFPFGQIIAFAIVFKDFKTKKSTYKIYNLGLLLGGIYLLIFSLTSILVIGVDTATNTYYSTYYSVQRINIASIIQRVEVVVAVVFLLGGFIKIGMLILCTCKGLTKIFGFKDYRFIVTIITLLVINLSFFQYDSVFDYNEFQFEIWLYFTSPFQVILPIVIWITAEIKKKRLVKQFK